MRVPFVDMGSESESRSRSPSAVFQDLVAADNLAQHPFNEVVAFLSEGDGHNLWEIEKDVWGTDPEKRLMVDNGHTMVNCPPPPEPGDNHGGLLVRTFSDRIAHDETGEENIVLQREFKIHDLGEGEKPGFRRVEVRCDTARADDNDPHRHVISEERAVIQVMRPTATAM